MKVKKALLFAFLILTLTSFSFPSNAIEVDGLKTDDFLRLNDMVLTLLMPHISDEVDKFYEPYLTIEPTVATYYASEIVHIKGGEHIHEGIYNSHYTITVVVFPYVGSHLSVGKDRITFSFNPSGLVLEEYEHSESYTLPPNYQSSIKKPLP